MAKLLMRRASLELATSELKRAYRFKNLNKQLMDAQISRSIKCAQPN